MTNAVKNLGISPYGKGGRKVVLGVDGGSVIYAGTLVAQLLATAMLVAGSTALSGPAIGVATMKADNTAGADGAVLCEVEYDAIFIFANGTSGDACSTATPFGAVVYMGDDHTIFDNSAGGTLQPAGYFCGMEPDGRVRVFVGAPQAFFASLTSQKSIPLSLHSFREVDANGDVGAIVANGGILASDTTPIMRGNAQETHEIAWAAGNTDPIATQIALPLDFDGTKDVTVDLFVYTDNAGGGGIDAATFTVESGWDNGALVSDTATDGTPAVTMHKVTATIAAADIPDTASILYLALTPAAHAADPTQLLGARVNYTPKLATA